MALSGKVAFNTGIQVISKIIGTLVSLAAVALITRYLGSFGFGHYTTAITFVTFFSIAGDFGLTLVTTQMISKPGVDQNRIISNLFSFRLATAFVVLTFAPLFVIFFPYPAIVKQGVAVASLAFFFILLNQVFVSLFQKELRADRIALAEVISRIIVFLLTVMVAWFNWGMVGMLWAMAIGNALSFAIHYYYGKAYARIRLIYEKAVWKDIAKRSWPFMLTIVLNLVYLKTDTLILSLMKNASEVGLYGAAYKVIDVLVSVPFMLGGTVLPILSLRWQSGKHEDYKRAWQKIFDATSVLVWPMVIGGFVLATPIMTLVAGEEFHPAGAILKILIFAVGGIFFSSFFGYTMVSFNAQRKMIGAYIFTALSALILYLIFIPKFSYMGAAWVTVYSEVAISLASWWLVWKQSKLTLKYVVCFKALIAALIMGLVVSWLPIHVYTVIGLTAAIIVGAIVYALLSWLLGAIKKRDLKELLSRNVI